MRTMEAGTDSDRQGNILVIIQHPLLATKLVCAAFLCEVPIPRKI